MDNTQATEVPQELLCVNQCFFEGSLAGHLLQNPDCCTKTIEKYLCNRQAVYEENPRLAVFDLAALLLFCPNPACTTPLNHQGRPTRDVRTMIEHIRGPCLQFFRSEGVSLFKWQQDLNPDAICKKLSNRRCYLRKKTKTKTRMDAYKEEFGASLTVQCRMCLIKGPLSGLQQHQLQVVGGTAFMTDSKIYECSTCIRREEKIGS